MQLLRVIIVCLFAVQAVSAAVRPQSDHHLDDMAQRNRPWAINSRPEQKALIHTLNCLGISIDDAAASFSSLRISIDGQAPRGPAFRADQDDLRDALAEKPRTPAKPTQIKIAPDLEGSLSNESKRLSRLEASLSALSELDQEALAKWRVQRALKKLEKRILQLEGSYAGLKERSDFLAADTIDWQIERLLRSVRALRKKAH